MIYATRDSKSDYVKLWFDCKPAFNLTDSEEGDGEWDCKNHISTTITYDDFRALFGVTVEQKQCYSFLNSKFVLVDISYYIDILKEIKMFLFNYYGTDNVKEFDAIKWVIKILEREELNCHA